MLFCVGMWVFCVRGLVTTEHKLLANGVLPRKFVLLYVPFGLYVPDLSYVLLYANVTLVSEMG